MANSTCRPCTHAESLSVLFHTVLGWVDTKYHLVRQALASPANLLSGPAGLNALLLFESWDQLLGFMLQGLEITMPPDAS